GGPSIPAFRPPFGAWDSAVLQGAAAEGYDLYLWEIDSNGYRRGAHPATVAAGVVSSARAGSIILMHPLAYGDRSALAAVVDGLRTIGLEPARLSDLLHATV
ncbi:MAG: polysaccharide deacetylase family protein, partial [Patescibacteria group bacterium]|nr:polysaccharide deacetylase family protein [Patescibacteria group bacterium]